VYLLNAGEFSELANFGGSGTTLPSTLPRSGQGFSYGASTNFTSGLGKFMPGPACI
jgi:hypothetical protein